MSAKNSPREQPIHTISAELIPSLAPKVMAVSCVLSPSSATKKVQKTASGANRIPGSAAALIFLIIASPASVDAAKYRNASAAMTLMSQAGNEFADKPAGENGQAVQHQDCGSGSQYNIS